MKGHISPNTGYYGFYNTQTRQWDREFLGALLTWYGADEADADIPFSMDNVVYVAWNGLYDGNGTLLRTIELDKSEYEYIHGLKCVGTGVEVYILNAEMKERTVLVNDILQTEAPASPPPKALAILQLISNSRNASSLPSAHIYRLGR